VSRSLPFLRFSVVFLTCTLFSLFFALEITRNNASRSQPFLRFSVVCPHMYPFSPVICPKIKLVKLSIAGTVEAGAGAGGEGVKRKRSDDMAVLEADLAPEPQAGMTQSLASISSPHLYQQSPPVSASPTSISSLCLYHSTCQAHQLHWWAVIERCCLQKNANPTQERSFFCFRKRFFGQVLLGHVNVECLHMHRTTKLNNAVCICCLAMQT